MKLASAKHFYTQPKIVELNSQETFGGTGARTEGMAMTNPNRKTSAAS